jgi:hypothetical protein
MARSRKMYRGSASEDAAANYADADFGALHPCLVLRGFARSLFLAFGGHRNFFCGLIQLAGLFLLAILHHISGMGSNSREMSGARTSMP